jgi:hypothetical protein
VAEGFLRRAAGFTLKTAGRRVAPPEPDGDAFYVVSFKRD